MISPSSPFSLTGPDTALSGESIQFTWTREAGDPVSFGLMQRSLSGDAPILGINGVPNEAGATSGTASVVFQTAGQVILSGVDQLSYNPDSPPNQLAPGKQLAIAESGLPPDPPASAPPIEETSTTPESTPESTSTLPPTTPTTTSTTPTPSAPTSSNQVANQPPASFSSTTFGAGLVNPKPQQSAIGSTKPSSLPGPGSADPSASTTPKRSLSEQDQSTVVPPHSESSSQGLTQIPGSPESSGTSIPTPAAQHAASNSGGGPNKQVVIAAVVTVCLLLSVGGLVIFLRRQRASTARRLHRFRQRMNTIFSAEAYNRAYASIPLWWPAHVIDIDPNNGLRTKPSAGTQPGAEIVAAPVITEKQDLTDVPAAPDITSDAANNCGSPARTTPIPITPPPSYYEHVAYNMRGTTFNLL